MLYIRFFMFFAICECGWLDLAINDMISKYREPVKRNKIVARNQTSSNSRLFVLNNSLNGTWSPKTMNLTKDIIFNKIKDFSHSLINPASKEDNGDDVDLTTTLETKPNENEMEKDKKLDEDEPLLEEDKIKDSRKNHNDERDKELDLKKAKKKKNKSLKVIKHNKDDEKPRKKHVHRKMRRNKRSEIEDKRQPVGSLHVDGKAKREKRTSVKRILENDSFDQETPVYNFTYSYSTLAPKIENGPDTPILEVRKDLDDYKNYCFYNLLSLHRDIFINYGKYRESRTEEREEISHILYDLFLAFWKEYSQVLTRGCAFVIFKEDYLHIFTENRTVILPVLPSFDFLNNPLTSTPHISVVIDQTTESTTTTQMTTLAPILPTNGYIENTQTGTTRTYLQSLVNTEATTTTQIPQTDKLYETKMDFYQTMPADNQITKPYELLTTLPAIPPEALIEKELENVNYLQLLDYYKNIQPEIGEQIKSMRLIGTTSTLPPNPVTQIEQVGSPDATPVEISSSVSPIFQISQTETTTPSAPPQTDKKLPELWQTLLQKVKFENSTTRNKIMNRLRIKKHKSHSQKMQ